MRFNKLMIEKNGNFDEQEMCVEWVNYCDGKLIFPKLPYYMRDHYKSWKCNQAAWHQVDSTNFKKRAEGLRNVHKDSSKLLPRPQVQASSTRMEDEISAAAAPSDGIDILTTSEEGAGKVIAGISVATVVHDPKAPERIRTQGQRAADKGKQAVRTCHWCSGGSFPRSTHATCPGRNNRNKCLYFDENGNRYF
jgi:hypothetical protein